MANFCTNCGQKLSFLERHDNDTLCGECRATLANAHRAQLATLEQGIAASRTTTSEQIALLKTYDHKTLLDLYYRSTTRSLQIRSSTSATSLHSVTFSRPAY